MSWKLLTLLAVVVAAVAADVATITPCDLANQDESKCTINEVRITPCHNKKDVCKLKKGTEAQISMDFTPNFTATKLKIEVYDVFTRAKWVDGSLSDDACQYTTCPSQAGKQQQFNYGLHIGKKLPNGMFTTEWQVYDEADNTNMCCFRTVINLR